MKNKLFFENTCCRKAAFPVLGIRAIVSTNTLRELGTRPDNAKGDRNMRIMKLALTGMALALAGTLTVGMADTAFAKVKKHAATASEQTAATPEKDRQLEGRFYRSHKNHKAKKVSETK
jgi:hypothetical protein